MSTHFPKVFPVDQVKMMAQHLAGKVEVNQADWVDNVRAASFAQGTLLTYYKSRIAKVTPDHVAAAKAMSDEELSEAVLQAVESKGKILGSVATLLSPELVALVLELIIRYLTQSHAGIEDMVASTTEAVPESTDEASAQ